MKLVIRSIAELSSTAYRACYQLNLRNDGLMREKLVRCRRENTGWTVMLFEDDGVLLSWALVFDWDLDRKQQGAYFYTRKTARRKGYGKQIADEIKKQFDNVIVWPSDNQGRSFFNNYKFTQRMTYWIY